MPSSPHTLIEPGHEVEWARLDAEKHRALAPAPQTTVGELLRRGQSNGPYWLWPTPFDVPLV